MRKLSDRRIIPLLVLAFPIVVLADISGKPTLAPNTALNLDTGLIASSGGDILWNGSGITPQGGATATNLGTALSGPYFSGLNQTALQVLQDYSAASINSGSIVLNDVFAVHTNGGHYAAVLVTAINGQSISLQFTTFGATSAPAIPTITQVLNNYGLVPAGFSNSGIAPGSLFIIKGSGLADPSAQAVLQSSGGTGLAATLNGASVAVTVNGTTTVPVFYYAIAAQLALVLPSATPLGTGQVTVTYNGQTSAPFSIQVVQSAVGFDAYYGTGSGLGVATNAVTGALYTYNNAIAPGTTVVLWGSGLGADPARDTTFVPAAFGINNLAHVYVGGVDAPIGYQGASGYPGLNQVNITIPASGVATGCNVSVVGVTTGGIPTNFITLPIGNGPCVDQAFGISGTPLQTLSGRPTVRTGSLGIYQATLPATSGGTQASTLALAHFESNSGSAYGSSSGAVSIGGCIATQNLSGSNSTATELDAGAITIVGPNGNAVLSAVPGDVGSYYAQLPSGFLTSAGGSFTFHGAGGADVGSFSAVVAFPTPLLSWINQSAAATVTRANGLPVSWTGGASGTFVAITGNASTPTVSGGFTCIVPTTAGQFTVPGYVLMALPAATGAVGVANDTDYQTFTTTGLDYGVAVGYVLNSVNSTFN